MLFLLNISQILGNHIWDFGMFLEIKPGSEMVISDLLNHCYQSLSVKLINFLTKIG